jgi:hypothetical protein
VKNVPILGIGLQSRSSNVTAQTRLNCYMEQSDDKSEVVAYGTPGLTQVMNFGDNPIRGMYALGDYFYIVQNNSLWKVNNAYAKTLAGTLATSSGWVDITDNGIDLVLVDGASGYRYTILSGAFNTIVDADFPAGATTATFSDSFIIVNKGNSQQFNWSASYNAATWDGLDFVSAESFPDNIVRVSTNNGYVHAFGVNSTQVFSANQTGYSTISGLTSEHGLVAIRSLAKINDSFIFLSINKRGESQVVMLAGGQISKVSTPDLDNIINGYATVTNATAFSYTYNGHEFYQINFVESSWLYDGTMQLWTKLNTGTGRHLAEMAIVYLNKVLVSDYLHGTLYQLDKNALTDNGIPIIFELTSKHIFNNLEPFAIRELQIECETGVGIDTGQGSDPQMQIGISKDHGHNFTWSFASMGKKGDFTARCRRYRLGIARNWNFRIRITDPVKRVLLGAWIN